MAPPIDQPLTARQNAFLAGTVLFFALLPTRSFIAVASDVMQVAVIIAPFAVAFMTVMLSVDMSFGLSLPPEAAEQLSQRRSEFSAKLDDLLRLSVFLIVLTLAAKALAAGYVGRGWFAEIVNRSAASLVGGTLAALLIRLDAVRQFFAYLSTGADIATFVRVRRGQKDA